MAACGRAIQGKFSIAIAWSQGVGKLPLRLNFTHFKDTFPDVADQRFWGFKDLLPPTDSATIR